MNWKIMFAIGLSLGLIIGSWYTMYEVKQRDNQCLEKLERCDNEIEKIKYQCPGQIKVPVMSNIQIT
jgi:hypothetical protein